MRSRLTRWGAFVLLLGTCVLGSMPVARAAPRTPTTPNDPAFGMQWNLAMIGAPNAWQVGTGAGSTIAIVDSGIDLGHEDLQGKIVGHVTCVGAAGDSSKCTDGGMDDNGHGTHVAGIAAANTDNGIGVAGVAPDASILDVKVLTQTCDTINGCDASGSADDVIAGIDYAVDHGATVINLSLGNTTQAVLGHSFASAVNAAFSRGVISVIAAGNDYLLPSHGSDVNAFVVGALNKDDVKASYANSIGDARWGLMAPGGEPDTQASCQSDPVGVLSTYMPKYACLAGTSMAAPHVAGAVAILRSLGYSPQATVDRLLSTARYVGSSAVYGAGALDLSAAVGSAPVAADPGTSSAEAPSSSDTESATSSSSSTPSAARPPGDLGAPTSTTPPGVINVPPQRAAGATTGRVITRTPPGDDLATGPVVVAVLMAASVGAASGWFLIRGSGWARRTPPL